MTALAIAFAISLFLNVVLFMRANQLRREINNLVSAIVELMSEDLDKIDPEDLPNPRLDDVDVKQP